MADRLGPRRAIRFAFGLLLFLYGTAVFAPLLASDLPLTMVASNERAFFRALRTLPIVVEEAETKLSGGEASEASVRAVRLRLDELQQGLRGERYQLVEDYRQSFEALVSDPGNSKSVGKRFGALRDELGLEGAGLEDSELVATRSYPVFAALTPLDAFWMASFFALLFAPLCVPRRAGPWLLASTLLMTLSVGASSSFGRADLLSGLKADMTSGDVRVESALYVPVPFGFAETHLDEGFLPPSWARTEEQERNDSILVRAGEPEVSSLQRHWLGTDALGRDVLSRLLHGGRLSLAVGLLAALIVCVLGVVLGTAAGMFGGWVDLCFLRLVEIVQSFPAFLLILAGVAFIPTGALHPAITIAIVIGIVGWTEIARLVRAELLRLRELELATAARALGIPPLRIAFRHLLPLALPPVLVAAAFATSGAVLTESAISFLGFGIGPPVPSWGGLIAVERDASIWWLQLFPGLFVFLTVLAFNLLGEGLRGSLRAGSGGANVTGGAE